MSFFDAASPKFMEILLIKRLSLKLVDTTRRSGISKLPMNKNAYIHFRNELIEENNNLKDFEKNPPISLRRLPIEEIARRELIQCDMAL